MSFSTIGILLLCSSVNGFVSVPGKAHARRALSTTSALKSETQLALGLSSLLAVVANRIFLAGELPAGAQSRADLIGVAAAIALLLDGVSRRSIDTIPATKLSLSGQRGKGISTRLDPDLRAFTDWTATSLYKSLPDATSVYIWTKEQGTILRLGILGTETTINADATTILDARQLLTPTYLPDLQALPARADFPFLPKRSQAALLVPLRPSSSQLQQENLDYVANGVIVIATDRKRAFSLRDQAWASQFAVRLANVLFTTPPSSPSP